MSGPRRVGMPQMQEGALVPPGMTQEEMGDNEAVLNQGPMNAHPDFQNVGGPRAAFVTGLQAGPTTPVPGLNPPPVILHFPNGNAVPLAELGPKDIRVPLPGEYVLDTVPNDTACEAGFVVLAGTPVKYLINACGVLRWTGSVWIFLVELGDELLWVEPAGSAAWKPVSA